MVFSDAFIGWGSIFLGSDEDNGPSGKVPGAAELATLAQHHSRAIFPAGAPPWYPAFSNAVYTNLHSAAAGQESVAGAISAIAYQIESLGG